MHGFDELLAGRPLVAILRGVPVARAVEIARVVWESGLGVVEVPIQTPEAVTCLRELVRVAAEVNAAAASGSASVSGDREPAEGREVVEGGAVPNAVAGTGGGRAIVGAGTVRSPAQVAVAADAGARFTVAPGLDRDVIRASHEAGMPHLPGVATASEVHHALNAGCGWLKAFPAGSLGPGWLREMRGPFPEARFVATGGVDAGNARDYLAAGAAALGVGGAVTRAGGLSALLEVLAEVEAARHGVRDVWT